MFWSSMLGSSNEAISSQTCLIMVSSYLYRLISVSLFSLYALVKGSIPIIKHAKVNPSEYTSVSFSRSVNCPSSYSGAAKASVPPGRQRKSPVSRREWLKSVSLALKWPSISKMRMFPGFRSPWMMPQSWRVSRPTAISRDKDHFVEGGKEGYLSARISFLRI